MVHEGFVGGRGDGDLVVLVIVLNEVEQDCVGLAVVNEGIHEGKNIRQMRSMDEGCPNSPELEVVVVVVDQSRSAAVGIVLGHVFGALDFREVEVMSFVGETEAVQHKSDFPVSRIRQRHVLHIKAGYVHLPAVRTEVVRE